jgi:hypothetical protein
MHLTPFFVLMWVAPLLGSSNFKCKLGKEEEMLIGNVVITHLCFVWPTMIAAEL